MFRSKLTSRALLVLVASLGLAFLVTASPASAAPAETHCATQVGTAPGKALAPTRCFSSFDESIAFATGGRAHLSNATASRHVSAAELGQSDASTSPSVPLTNYVLSIVYKSANYGGSTYDFYASGVCGSWQVGSMPSGWNDAIRSLANYSGCAATLYQNGGFGQPVYDTGVDASVPSLGGFNGTSCIKWCTYFGCT